MKFTPGDIRDLFVFNFQQEKLAKRANHPAAHNNALRYLIPYLKSKPQILRDSVAGFFKNHRPEFIPEDYSEAKALYEKQNAEGCPVNPNDLKVGDWVTIAYGDSWTVRGSRYASYFNNTSFGWGDEDFEVGRIISIEEIGDNFYYRLDSRDAAVEFRRVRPATQEEIEKSISETAQLSIN